MTININPNRINVSGGATGRTSEQRRRSDGKAEFTAPAKAHLNVMPEPESLATLIRSAVAALREGVYWDRGTIVNLVV